MKWIEKNENIPRTDGLIVLLHKDGTSCTAHLETIHGQIILRCAAMPNVWHSWETITHWVYLPQSLEEI